MPIPRQRISIKLINFVPQEKIPGYTSELLKKQLNVLGLNCIATSDENLKVFISDVMSKTNIGDYQCFGVFKKDVKSGNILKLNTAVSWEIDDSVQGLADKLYKISSTEGFKFLKNNYPSSFTGKSDYLKLTNNNAKTDTVKGIFTSISQNISALVSDGVKDKDLQTILSTQLGVDQFPSTKNYEHNADTFFGLVKKYNPESEDADAIAMLNISFKVKVDDLHKDKNGKYDSSFETNSRFVQYTDINILNSDYDKIKDIK